MEETLAKRKRMNTSSSFITLSPLVEDAVELAGQEDRMASLFEDDEVPVISPPAATLTHKSSKSPDDGAHERKQVTQAGTSLIGAEGSSFVADRG